MTDLNEKLADVVLNDPSRARTLDRLGLDYCCGGAETLDHACARLGLDVSEVVAELDTAAPVGDNHSCGEASPAELVRHLVDVHHTYLHAELPHVDQVAQKVLDVHGKLHPELHEVRALVAALRNDLEPHMQKEESVLFPAILELLDGPAQFAFGSIANPINTMRIEHDRAGEILTRLRTTTNNYSVPHDGCASYRSLYQQLSELEHDTHLHVFEENHLLFPQAAALEASQT